MRTFFKTAVSLLVLTITLVTLFCTAAQSPFEENETETETETSLEELEAFAESWDAFVFTVGATCVPAFLAGFTYLVRLNQSSTLFIPFYPTDVHSLSPPVAAV